MDWDDEFENGYGEMAHDSHRSGSMQDDFLHSLYPRANITIKYILHPSGQYTKQHPDKQVQLVRDITSLF